MHEVDNNFFFSLRYRSHLNSTLHKFELSG